MMSVKIQSNSRQLISERNNRVSLAIRLMLEAVHRESLPNTPKEHGNLRADVVKSVQGNKGSIVWDKNYAQAQEEGRTRGIVMKNYTTPGTGPHFARRAVTKVARDSRSYFARVGL